VVDLDGAFKGTTKNTTVVRNIIASVDIPAELGGGIRDVQTAGAMLDTGIDRVIIGTRACDLDFVRELVACFGDRVAVGIDAKEGQVSVRGWEEVTSLTALDFARTVEDAGVATIIYTDVARDGALQGPNLAAMAEMLNAVDINVIASGGVTTVGDVEALCRLTPRPPDGVIIGKALYTGDVDLKDALETAERCSPNG
jgi:phosphoribosylformimino-5-aminoimidazole carboxamide ribotide isomerase